MNRITTRTATDWLENITYRLTSLLWIGSITCALLTAIFLWLKFPDNYGSGVDTLRNFYIGYGIVSLLFCVRGDRYALYALAVCIGMLLLTFPMDYFNVYISYEDWIDRGHPAWGERHPTLQPRRHLDDVLEELF